MSLWSPPRGRTRQPSSSRLEEMVEVRLETALPHAEGPRVAGRKPFLLEGFMFVHGSDLPGKWAGRSAEDRYLGKVEAASSKRREDLIFPAGKSRPVHFPPCGLRPAPTRGGLLFRPSRPRRRVRCRRPCRAWRGPGFLSVGGARGSRSPRSGPRRPRWDVRERPPPRSH